MNSSSFDVGSVFRESGQRYVVTDTSGRKRVIRNVATEELGIRTLASLTELYIKGNLQFEDLATPPQDTAGAAVLPKSFASYPKRKRPANPS